MKFFYLFMGLKHIYFINIYYHSVKRRQVRFTYIHKDFMIRIKNGYYYLYIKCSPTNFALVNTYSKRKELYSSLFHELEDALQFHGKLCYTRGMESEEI